MKPALQISMRKLVYKTDTWQRRNRGPSRADRGLRPTPVRQAYPHGDPCWRCPYQGPQTPQSLTTWPSPRCFLYLRHSFSLAGHRQNVNLLFKSENLLSYHNPWSYLPHTNTCINLLRPIFRWGAKCAKKKKKQKETNMYQSLLVLWITVSCVGFRRGI